MVDGEDQVQRPDEVSKHGGQVEQVRAASTGLWSRCRQFC
jgi:hypothetical protein